MKAKELNLLSDRIPSLFLSYAIPGILSSLSMCLYGIINGIILGRYVGSNALAAVNMASPIFNIISCIAILISIGGNTLVGISLGEKNQGKANHYFNNAFYALLVIACLIWVSVVFFPTSLAKIIGANAVLIPLVSDYIKTFGFFIIPIIFNILLGISLQSIGKPQLYMIGNMLTMILNICLDLIFICVLGWEIKGAALASGISASIVFIIFISKFISKNSILKIGKCKVDFKSLRQMSYNGSSEAITQFCGGLSSVLFNLILIKKFGEAGVSAFAAIQYISLVINAVIMGMTRGVAPIISVNYGGKEILRVKQILTLTIKTVTSVGIVCTIVVLLLRNPLISIFITNNQKVFDTSMEAIIYYSFSFIFVGTNVAINTFYTAVNNPKTSAILAVCRYFLLIGCFFTLPIFIGNIGLWLAFVIGEIVCLIISALCIKSTQNRWLEPSNLSSTIN